MRAFKKFQETGQNVFFDRYLKYNRWKKFKNYVEMPFDIIQKYIVLK